MLGYNQRGSLARLGSHDQAYKHLLHAWKMEEGKDAVTAGYLALCGAMGTPTNPEDRPKNVAWAESELEGFLRT